MRPNRLVISGPSRNFFRLLLGILLLAVAVPLGTYGYHEYLMWRCRGSVSRLPFPAETQILGMKQQFGLSSGANGNHCDPEIFLLVATTVDPATFAAFAVGPHMLDRPFTTSPGRLLLREVEEKGAPLALRNRNRLGPFARFYLLTAYDESVSEGTHMLDVRCH